MYPVSFLEPTMRNMNFIKRLALAILPAICLAFIVFLGCSLPYYVNVKPDNKSYELRCTLNHKAITRIPYDGYVPSDFETAGFEVSMELRGISHSDVQGARLAAILPAGIKEKEIRASLASHPRKMAVSGKTAKDGADVTCITWAVSNREWESGTFEVEVTMVSGRQFVVTGRRPPGGDEVATDVVLAGTIIGLILRLII